MNFLNTWQFNLLMYYVFNVIFFQFYKLSVRNLKKDGAGTVIFQAIAGISQLLIAPFFIWKIPSSVSVVILLLVACIFYAINDRLQTTVRKNLEVSTSSILSQFGTVFLIIYGFIIFRNQFVLTKIIGALLIIGANAWIFYKPSKKKATINRYYILGIVSLLAFATAITIDIGISGQFNLPFYIAFTLLVPAAMIAISEKISIKSITEEWKRGNSYFFIVTGFSWGLTILFGLRAYQFGNVNTIIPLQAVPVILNVMAAYFFLKEKDDALKKLIAAFIVVIGVYLTVQ
jgi:drug/metabolite transporter (DMT)-like permease